MQVKGTVPVEEQVRVNGEDGARRTQFGIRTTSGAYQRGAEPLNLCRAARSTAGAAPDLARIRCCSAHAAQPRYCDRTLTTS
jgi:hypothetical protein